FVYLRAVDPTIAQDIRYAGSDNFVGRPLPGYEVAECILRRDVAAALKRVQADLAASGLSLKVYDCYRPARAVRAMAGWVNDRRSEAATQRFFPKLAKSSLLRAGYNASRSRQSSGDTTDPTLVPTAAVALAARGPLPDRSLPDLPHPHPPRAATPWLCAGPRVSIAPAPRATTRPPPSAPSSGAGEGCSSRPCANRDLQITIMNGGTFLMQDPPARRPTIFRFARASDATAWHISPQLFAPPSRPGSSSRYCTALPAS